MRKNKKSIGGKNWNRKISIDRAKYEIISKAINKTLAKDPVSFSELAEEVKKQVKDFPGSVSWYTIAVLRELERQGKVVRDKGKRVSYRKP